MPEDMDTDTRRDMLADIRGSIESVERWDFPELFNEIDSEAIKELLAARTAYILEAYNLGIPNGDSAQFGILLSTVQSASREIPLFGDWLIAALNARGISPRPIP